MWLSWAAVPFINFHITNGQISFKRCVDPTTSKLGSIWWSSRLLLCRSCDTCIRREHHLVNIDIIKGKIGKTWWGWFRLGYKASFDLFYFKYDSRSAIQKPALKLAVLVANSFLGGILSILVFGELESVSSSPKQCLTLVTEILWLLGAVLFLLKEYRHLLQKLSITFHQVTMNDVKAKSNLKPSEEAISFLRCCRSESFQ